MVSNKKLTIDVLYLEVCKSFGVDSQDSDIRKAFDKVMNNLERKQYVILSEVYSAITLSGEKGFRYPFSILMEVTDKCNLKCKHCYRDAKYEEFKEMSWDDFTQIVAVFKNKTPNLIMSGGELTTHSRISQILQVANDSFNVFLLSNGLMISRIPEEELKKVNYIQISMYGYDEKSYYLFTGARDCFQKIEKCIHMVNRLKIDHVVVIIVTKENFKNIRRIIECLVSLNVRRVAFGLSIPLGRAKESDKHLELSQNEKEMVVQEIKGLDYEYKGKIDFLPYTGLAFKGNELNAIDERLIFKCSAGKTNVVIDPNAFVRPCHMIPRDAFVTYSVNEYIRDIKKHRIKDYSNEILKYEQSLMLENRSVRDMKCAGFCNLQ
ncbi:radical SAM protein [Butyrivibrio sp. MC2013]|uniref:radical SAM protein n=1 Tax=Butyrivibrio sp. MC2013 TaxID=1280686 RepID=UPI0018CBBC87|nr:radical SAM protein [Butyrivibrio sp. MC2013]